MFPGNGEKGEVILGFRSSQADDLIEPDVRVERLATGFGFAEGPIWIGREPCLLFSDIPGDVRRRWDALNGVRTLAAPTNKGNGMTLGADGRLIVCEHSTSMVVRLDAEGSGKDREVLASHYEGKELNSPNDVVVSTDGSIYFTDPAMGRRPVFGDEREQVLDFQGVYRIRPSGELDLLVDDFDGPNGLCFSPEESVLYVSDTYRAHIRVFDVSRDGTLVNGRLFAESIGTGVADARGCVDGMKCDERGNVWVSGPEGIWIFDPAGQHIAVIAIPEIVANFNWGGPSWKWMFVCATTSVYRFETKICGHLEPYMRNDAR
jgi:gluconolactonase